MKLIKEKIFKPELVFLLILIAIGFLFNYHHIAFQRPVGIHQWRNCVSAAFPVNYYYGGNFFTSQTNAMLADHSTSDISVVEFPLIYFMISLLYRVFGVHEFWFRMFQVFIGFAGLIYLFKASHYFTRDWFYAGMVPLIIFTTPIYAFYLNNFIPDAVALSLTFIGFYYFMKYTKQRKFRIWLLAMLFFLLAGLTKTASLLPFLGLGGVALIDLIQRRRRPMDQSCFIFKFKYFASFGMVLILIFGWYLYAYLYSDAHAGGISAVEIRPIWKLDNETIRATLLNMKDWYRGGVYQKEFFLIISLLVVFALLPFYKKANSFLYIFNILVFIGAISFTLLFFRSMRDHDYYQINNLFLFVTLYLTLFNLLAEVLPRVYRSIWTRLSFGLLLVMLVINCQHRINVRYSEHDTEYVGSMKLVSMFDIEDYLDEIGIERTDMVYCTPDHSINISLYLCNRKGLTDYSEFWKLSLEERLEKMKEIHIEYLILGSRDKYKDVENLDDILGEKIGQIGETEIYKL